jgi:hypothetical protein
MTCADIITTLATPDADAFPVFYDLDEYQGFDYGMNWPGMYSAAFTSCADLAIGSIVWPGDGISQAWLACMPGPVAITGWAWIWDYGIICVIPHPEPGVINIGDCQAYLIEPLCPPIQAGIGGFIGDDPCDATGTDRSTWSSIKSMFE